VIIQSSVYLCARKDGVLGNSFADELVEIALDRLSFFRILAG